MTELWLDAIGYQLKSVDYGSNEYHQALQIRYQLFYQIHNIPIDSIIDPTEENHLHLVITEASSNRVLAYGRLGQNSPHEFQIYQMVVALEYQQQGLGKRILNALVDAAIQQGAERLVLHARVAKMQFYKKSGFMPVGAVFPSLTTSVPHIKMQKIIE